MIVIATEEELGLVTKSYQPVLITGAGACNVIKALSDLPRETPIFNIGYVGSNVLPVGTHCRIGKCTFYHPFAEIEEPTFLLDGNVHCYTAGDFVVKTALREPCVFDMELAYILALGFKNVVSEKIVSDNLSRKEYEECLKK